MLANGVAGKVSQLGDDTHIEFRLGKCTMTDSRNFDAKKERVKQATDIVDLVSQSVELKRQGSNHVGLCPWHEDKKPSFTVNQTRQRYSCWVCDLHGDVFDFTMETEKVDFREALKILAKAAGIDFE